MTDELILAVREDLLEREQYKKLCASTSGARQAFYDELSIALHTTLGFDGEVHGDRSIAAELHLVRPDRGSEAAVKESVVDLARRVFDVGGWRSCEG